eukprot:6725067-Ditylum_brightwellii.AAC.1
MPLKQSNMALHRSKRAAGLSNPTLPRRAQETAVILSQPKLEVVDCEEAIGIIGRDEMFTDFPW